MHRFPCALNSFRCDARSGSVAAGFMRPLAPDPQLARPLNVEGTHIYEKLHAASKAEAVMHAARHGWLD